jgi:hypothetical protein
MNTDTLGRAWHPLLVVGVALPFVLSCGACAGSSNTTQGAEAQEETEAEPAAPAEPVESNVAVSEPEPPALAPTLTEEQLASYGMPYQMIEGEPMFTVLEEDGIPAIDEPVFVSVEEALEFMDLEEPVMGVVGKDGTAKCYSAWQLDSHEIVNDQLDGQAIAATW